MAKPNHFCSGYMWTFLYFGVSVWPGEKILSFRAVPIDTSWRQQALSATLKQHLGGSGDVVEFCWCQFVSVDVNLCMDGVWRMYWGYLDGVSVCLWCSDVSGCSSLAGWRIYTVLAQPSVRQFFFHLAILRYQNIKMSRYQLPKNHWVMQFI